jgi:hypothetical protein
VGEEGSDNLKKVFRDAHILFPSAIVLKDIVATMVVLSNEPGISADNARHYHLALLPGGLLFGGAGWAWLFNICASVIIGLLVSHGLRIGSCPSGTESGN